MCLLFLACFVRMCMSIFVLFFACMCMCICVSVFLMETLYIRTRNRHMLEVTIPALARELDTSESATDSSDADEDASALPGRVGFEELVRRERERREIS